MRHYEDYEMEHLRNGTGSMWERLRCAIHLRRCEICRARYETLLRNDEFMSELKKRLEPLQEIRGRLENDSLQKK